MQQVSAAACSVQSAALSAYTAALTEQVPWAHMHQANSIEGGSGCSSITHPPMMAML